VKIPIQNIYYLLCYAWDKLAERDVVAVEAIDTTTLADLFARVEQHQLISHEEHRRPGSRADDASFNSYHGP